MNSASRERGFSPGHLSQASPNYASRWANESIGVKRGTIAIRNLSNLRAPKKANENKKRIGRGMGSGMGKTSTRAHNGQASPSSSSLIPALQHAHLPLP